MLKIVLDTNVLISALLKPHSNPAIIVSLILDGRVILCLSQEILAEYKGVLKRNKFKGISKNNVKRFLQEIEKKALWVEPQESVKIIKADPGDNKFFECALTARADYLITGNIKHFSFKKFKKTEIATPYNFLNIIAKLFLNYG
ncbi:MAG: putative toxin-antitoxin system toxin component, PIN family [Deltaproteobacteria bacterium]|nr:putative toxin-antitoxin system toxin component, PIN family [Deltaproteobacteria bacterium]